LLVSVFEPVTDFFVTAFECEPDPVLVLGVCLVTTLLLGVVEGVVLAVVLAVGLGTDVFAEPTVAPPATGLLGAAR
jgi:hypothetical protein